MMKPFLLLALIILMAVSCKRNGEPYPRICTETNEEINDLVTMKLADTLTLVNCSKRYNKQRWVMPDGGTSTQETVYFIPSGLDTFTIRLFVSDDDFVNEYEATKRVVVNP
ncbi:MAG: hypothetical protein IPI46_08295 [Bacteroidetes bacterium]|nr:hypothetical protein [Bacteroidota bacterium]